MASIVISAIVVAASLPFLNLQSPARGEDAKLVRDYTEQFRMIAIENLAGPTEIRVWTESGVKVTASRPSSPDNSRIEAEVLFVRPARSILKIVANPDSLFRPITLTVLVPSAVQVSVRGGTDRVSVKGQPASLSIETQSGSVAIHLPEESNTDLSLRSLKGIIEARVPVTVFGQNDAHIFDGRIGNGGSPVIARSQRGNITVRSEGFSLSASTGERPQNPFSRDLVSSDANGTGTRPVSESTDTPAPDVVRGAAEDVIKLEARLVNLNVKVTDAAGKTLPALRKEDFVVFEDDVRQEVSYFEPVTAPLNMVLLLDLSGSTERKIKVMKKAAQKFIDSLKSTDRIAVAGFTRRFFIISNFTTDHNLLKDRIDDIKNRHSGTAYYDAMWATLDLLDEANTTRKAIVVLTDGVDNSLDHPESSEFDPKHGFDELLERTIEADATIYPIYLDTEYETIGSGGRSGHDAYVTARKQLQALADQTGAMMFKAERAEDLEGVYQQVAAELHSLYSMAYMPKTVRRDGKWRKITIGVELPGAKVRTKRGYFAK
jgi:Ca-activated chloride channel family protein